LLDLGPRARIALCAVFFGAEAILIATAPMRSDRSYGFRMFPESSTITLHVSRRMGDGSLVPIEKGKWEAHDCRGEGHAFVWGKMVRSPAPWRLDAVVGAPYGVESEVHRARDALRWVADHTPDDCETRALVASIDARKNGRVQDRIDFEVSRAP
jgi:hypothetical protein